MSKNNSVNQAPMLMGIALCHPEQTHYLGQVFNNTTNSYKLVWFLAILSLLKQGKVGALSLQDIFSEMATIAWHPVCFYRLSLGRQDKLQDSILDIKQNSGLKPNAQPETIRSYVNNSAYALSKMTYFNRYVPTRFIAPWFTEKLRGLPDAVRDSAIQTLAQESQNSSVASLYYFEKNSEQDAIRLNDSWHKFLLENLGVIEAFAEHHWALYLQARNPNVPGIVNKLRAPSQRQLNAARNFWRYIQSHFAERGEPWRFKDIYSEQSLTGSFSIDHFLPWSFVVHDLFWNLTPVESTTNSSKGDSIPDIDLYLPCLAKLHYAALVIAQERPTFLEDYTNCFKKNAVSLLEMGEDGLFSKYREIITPQAHIAINQGFQSGWKLHS